MHQYQEDRKTIEEQGKEENTLFIYLIKDTKNTTLLQELILDAFAKHKLLLFICKAKHPYLLCSHYTKD